MQVIVENVRSLYNIGSIFRTAAAAGCEHIYLCGLTPTPPRHELSKTALGGETSVPWSYHVTTQEAISKAISAGYTVAALELTEKAVSMLTAALPEKLALVIGHERTGVQAATLDQITTCYMLPMQPSPVHSLNVASAAAIALYIHRQQHPL